jgi:hypothetical protein
VLNIARAAADITLDERTAATPKIHIIDSGVAGIGHWRTHDHDEVDLVIERHDGAIIAFEIKAGSRVPGESFAPMRKLRDKVGDAFIAGVALYLGEWSYTFDDRLHVMPVGRLCSL